jgi:hypothetical protein
MAKDMKPNNQVEQFIEFARTSTDARIRLADCQIDLWEDSHLPVDIDINKVVAVARDYGYRLTLTQIIEMQCKKLSSFWLFEMENAFVARRTMELLQYHIDGVERINYYD